MFQRLAPALVAAMIAALALAAACDIQPLTSQGVDASDAGQSGQFCPSACADQQKCDASVVLATCENSCATQFGTRLSHVRADWLSSVTSCLASATCASWAYGTALSGCEDQASNAITASSTAQSYCTQAVAKDTACGVAGNETQASCVEGIKASDDPSLTVATSCLSQGCSAYPACVRTALGL